jgi:hypothetical protein
LGLVETLENQNKRIADLMNFANELDVSIKTDPEFINKKKWNTSNLNINVTIDQEQQNAF